MNPSLAQIAFVEGFATYIQYLINGKLPQKFEQKIKPILERRIITLLLGDEMVPYVLGYLAFLAISKLESEEQAIKAGLSLDSMEWGSKSKNAIAKLGKYYPI